MEFAQSRNSTRGPLIAVIKIQIDSERSDRIFLHNRDNDLQLAQNFVHKHDLNPAIVSHIYQRIKYSRQAVEQQYQKNTPFKPTQPQEQMHTPINQIHEHNTYTQESFGTVNPLSGRDNKSIFENRQFFQEQDTFSAPGRHTKQNSQCPAPKKKAQKEFMIYNKQNQEEGMDLFSSNRREANLQIQAQIEKITRNIQHLQEKSRVPQRINPLEVIKQQERREVPLRQSKSMMKLAKPQKQVRVEYNSNRKPSISLQKNARKQENIKPLNVKIMKKDEIESLNQSLKKSMSKQEISRINKDVTSRLYNESEMKKNYLQLIKKKAKQDKEKQIDPELTLKPKINPLSKVIAEGRRRQNVAIQDYLIEEGKKALIKRAQTNNEKMMKQLEHCSFKPEMNIISQKLTEDKENIESRLRQMSLKRNSRYQHPSFRPSLNIITQELMKGKGSFQERQKQYMEHRNQKLMEMVHQRLLGQKVDLQTGQQLFKPIINDMAVRENQGYNIGAYLHALSKEDTIKSVKQENKPRISETSQNMVQQMQMKRITWLFGQLDSDQDGVISAQKICIDSISAQILNVIKPILFEMQEMGEQLTLLEFRNAIQILHNKLNLSEKNILYHQKLK